MVKVMLESNLSHGTLGVASPGMPFNFVEKAYHMNRDVAWKSFVGTWLRVQIGSGSRNQMLTKWVNYYWRSA
jgi:hypothetical protein